MIYLHFSLAQTVLSIYTKPNYTMLRIIASILFVVISLSVAFAQLPQDNTGRYLNDKFEIRIGSSQESISKMLNGTIRKDSLVERFKNPSKYYYDPSYLEATYYTRAFDTVKQGEDPILTYIIFRWNDEYDDEDDDQDGINALLESIESLGYKKSLPKLKRHDRTYFHPSGKTGIQIRKLRAENQALVTYFPDLHEPIIIVGKEATSLEVRYHRGTITNYFTSNGTMMSSSLEPPKKVGDQMLYFEQDIWVNNESEQYSVDLINSLGFKRYGKALTKEIDASYAFKDLDSISVFRKPFNEVYQIRATVGQYYDKVDQFNYTIIKFLLIEKE